MIPEPTPGVSEREPHPAPIRSRPSAWTAPFAALVVLLIPAVIVPLSSLFLGNPMGGAGQLPGWATEAFGNRLLVSWLAATRLPPPVLALYGAVPLVVPAVVALLGAGTIGRWAALAGFCLVGSVLIALLGLGLLLELIAPGTPEMAIGLERLAGLASPLLALEGCGCLLASSVAASGSDDWVAEAAPRSPR